MPSADDKVEADISYIHMFRPGDLVRLKSGGPWMTVKYRCERDQGQERYWCCWFDYTGEVCTAIFPHKVLVKAEDGEERRPSILTRVLTWWRER